LNTLVHIYPDMTKPFLTERAPMLASLFLIGGLVLSALGIIGLTTKDVLNLGPWDYWLVMVGVPMLLIGIIWLWIYVARVKQFRKELQEKSKANFLKNMDETEYLAWRLPTKFEKELENKKSEFSIRK
jgi:SNF family Na+-dependent transporter